MSEAAKKRVWSAWGIACATAGALIACGPTGEVPQEVPGPQGIDVVTIDSCQYITWTGYRGMHGVALAIVHKANCPNHGGEP